MSRSWDFFVCFVRLFIYLSICFVCLFVYWWFIFVFVFLRLYNFVVIMYDNNYFLLA